MKKFRLKATVTISLSTVVEAETESEAIEIASSRELQAVPPDNYYTEDDFWITSGELDGTPTDIEVEGEETP